MAGTIPLSLTQQLDEFGAPLAGGKLYLIQAGTVATPQNGYQDSALTIPWPNPIVLDASGRLPQFFLADGSIKVRLTDVNGNQKFAQDGLIVTGASSGGGGGSPVDPTTIFQTGQLICMYNFGVLGGFVRANARTIGNATSSATERANADTLALFTFLWTVDTNLAVSGGRGGSAAADFAANKNIALPDFRGRVIAGLDDMGNTAAGRLTATYFGASGTTIGASGGAESKALLTANLPAYTPTGTIANGAITTTLGGFSGNLTGVNTSAGGGIGLAGGGNASNALTNTSPASSQATSTFAGAAQGGVSTPVTVAQPTMLATIYIKL